QKGIAEKYQSLIKKKKIKLIIKLNGKTNLTMGDFISRQLCSVKEAIKLGACAVGYTIYLGSKYESIMLQEFENIQREAHLKGIPVIAWIYPNKNLLDKENKKFMPYAARTGLEVGADIIKIKYSGNLKNLVWAVKSAGETKIVIAGGVKKNETLFLKQVNDIMKSGCIGLAVGRNVWQNKNPLEISEKIRGIIFK
ncbi:MAG: hypothetical protein NT076_03210, partial [Candidatus Pacearchaeota archaeon]|nr:hypothetical protein [Candidatus Pacearchaeota archaeon]